MFYQKVENCDIMCNKKSFLEVPFVTLFSTLFNCLESCLKNQKNISCQQKTTLTIFYQKKLRIVRKLFLEVSFVILFRTLFNFWDKKKNSLYAIKNYLEVSIRH